MKYITLCIILCTPNLFGSNKPSFLSRIFPHYTAHNLYKKKAYNQAQNILEKEQVDHPDDPLINYNLGTTYYKQKYYDLAAQNFTRAIQTHDQNLQEKAQFNLANCLYQKTLKLLPDNWEKEKIDEAIAQQAITHIKQSIEHYKKTLGINKQNDHATTNKKAAEKILEKLLKNKQKKQNNKKDQQQQQQKPPEPKKQQENFDQRRMKSKLAKLEQQEKAIQKKLLKAQLQKTKPNNQHQKPW